MRRRAAEFQTINLDDVPRDRDEMRAYYEGMRPRLAATEATQETVHHILGVVLPENSPLWQRPLQKLVSAATISTMPRWLRRMGGIRQSRLVDSLIAPIMRPFFRSLSRNPRRAAEMVGALSPATGPIMTPAFLGIPPVDPVTVTPAQAWQRAGRPVPSDQYVAQCAKRSPELVIKAPTDLGVAELQQFS